jgi:hypothetical protein
LPRSRRRVRPRDPRPRTYGKQQRDRTRVALTCQAGSGSTVNETGRDHPDTTTAQHGLATMIRQAAASAKRRHLSATIQSWSTRKHVSSSIWLHNREFGNFTNERKDTSVVGNKYPVGHLSPCRGIQSGQLGKITMSSWFISPWEAARLSLEAQRQVALLFFPYASRKERQPPEQGRQPLETASDDKSHVVTHQDIGSAHTPRSRRTAQAKTVTAHKSTQVMRNGTGSRKIKSRNRRRKSDKQRS